MEDGDAVNGPENHGGGLAVLNTIPTVSHFITSYACYQVNAQIRLHAIRQRFNAGIAYVGQRPSSLQAVDAVHSDTKELTLAVKRT